MPRTSTAIENNDVCPLCGQPLASDGARRGFVRHLEPPDGPGIFDDREKIDQMLNSGYLATDYMDYYNETGLCPYQRKQQDGPEVVTTARAV